MQLIPNISPGAVTYISWPNNNPEDVLAHLYRTSKIFILTMNVFFLFDGDYRQTSNIICIKSETIGFYCLVWQLSS